MFSFVCVPVLEITCAYANENIYICSWVKLFWNHIYIYIYIIIITGGGGNDVKLFVPGFSSLNAS